VGTAFFHGPKTVFTCSCCSTSHRKPIKNRKRGTFATKRYITLCI